MDCNIAYTYYGGYDFVADGGVIFSVGAMGQDRMRRGWCCNYGYPLRFFHIYVFQQRQRRQILGERRCVTDGIEAVRLRIEASFK